MRRGVVTGMGMACPLGLGVEHTAHHRVNRGAHAVHVDRGVALVRVDHVQPAPVPELHVDLSRPVLMVAGDHQPGRRPEILDELAQPGAGRDDRRGFERLVHEQPAAARRRLRRRDRRRQIFEPHSRIEHHEVF